MVLCGGFIIIILNQKISPQSRKRKPSVATESVRAHSGDLRDREKVTFSRSMHSM